VAFSCCFVPSAIEPFAGVMAIETNAGGPTVNVAEFVTVPEVAVMLAVPTAAPVANPLLETVAVAVAEELQVTLEVKSLELPSENVPFAVNC